MDPHKTNVTFHVILLIIALLILYFAYKSYSILNNSNTNRYRLQ